MHTKKEVKQRCKMNSSDDYIAFFQQKETKTFEANKGEGKRLFGANYASCFHTQRSAVVRQTRAPCYADPGLVFKISEL